MRLSKSIVANVKQFYSCSHVQSITRSYLCSSQNYVRFDLFSSSIYIRQFHQSSVLYKKVRPNFADKELVKQHRSAIGIPEPDITTEREQEEIERRKREEREQAERLRKLHETPQERYQREQDRKREWRQKYQMNSSVLRQEFFEDVKDKSKGNFMAAVDYFVTRDRFLRGHVEFIHAALKMMKPFGVHKDLECYKKLLDVFPKGKMVAQTLWQVEFMHYPKQQFCAIDVLEQMENNGVMGDREIEEMLANIFGKRSFPSRKHCRMMYWMPKFKNLSPWALPDPLPKACLELVKLAIKQITSVDPQTKLTIYECADLEDAVDHTWIVGGQALDQQELIESHPSDRPIYVEGAFRVWIRDQCINYFILRSEPLPTPQRKVEEEVDPDDVGVINHFFKEDYQKKDALVRALPVHCQDDGNILAVCATGTSSRDSLVSWITFLKETNPRLGKDISIVFTLKSPIGPTDNLEIISPEEEERQNTLGAKEEGVFGVGIGFDPKNPDLSQVGINPLSDTRFVNWPHHFNKRGEPVDEDERKRLAAKQAGIKIEKSSDTEKLTS